MDERHSIWLVALFGATFVPPSCTCVATQPATIHAESCVNRYQAVKFAAQWAVNHCRQSLVGDWRLTQCEPFVPSNARSPAFSLFTGYEVRSISAGDLLGNRATSCAEWTRFCGGTQCCLRFGGDINRADSANSFNSQNDTLSAVFMSL